MSDSQFPDSLYFQFLWASHYEEKILSRLDYDSLIAFERKFKEENKASFNKTTMLTERTNESLIPKAVGQNTVNNIEVLTFSGSRLKSQMDLKFVSPESPHSQSPFFKAGSSNIHKIKITAEKEDDLEVSELSNSSSEEKIPPSSQYSGQIANSLSPPSERGKLRTIINNSNYSSYSFAEKRAEFKKEVENPISLISETGGKISEWKGISETTI